MMNAAAGIFLAARRKPKWTNPYVTEGLVAMWDGEWNVGGGVHESDLANLNGKWKDLSGNGNDLVLNTAFCEITSNGMKRVYNTSANGPVGTLQMRTTYPVTIEACVTPSDRGLSRACPVVTYGPVNGTATSCLINKTPTSFEWSSRFNNRTAVFVKGVPVTVSSVAPGGSSDARGYRKATEISATSSDSWGFESDVVAVLGDSRNNDYVAFGYVAHNVRLYSRALTSAEIAENYAVDKARFNLP